MPNTHLYTVIVQSDDKVTNITFELSEELFQQALREIEAQRKEKDTELESLQTARNNQYQLFLMDDLPKGGQPVPEYAIYLGKDDYIVYGASGIKRKLLQYPTDWVEIASKSDLQKTEIKSAILDATLGKVKVEAPQSLTIQKYVDAYMKAHPKGDHNAYKSGYIPPKRFRAYPIHSANTNPIIIKGPDNKPRDITLKILEKDVFNNTASVEVHRFSAYKDNDQITLKTDEMNVSNLNTIKLYASNLLSALGIKVEDEQHYPKIEIKTENKVKVLEGTKAFYAKTLREKAKESVFIRNLTFSALLIAITAICLAVTLIPMSPLLIGLAGGILLIFGVAAGITAVESFDANIYLDEADKIEKLSASDPLVTRSRVTRKIFPWIQVRTESYPGGDLAILYREVFLSQKPQDINKPEATTNAEVSSKGETVTPSLDVCAPPSHPSSTHKSGVSK